MLRACTMLRTWCRRKMSVPPRAQQKTTKYGALRHCKQPGFAVERNANPTGSLNRLLKRACARACLPVFAGVELYPVLYLSFLFFSFDVDCAQWNVELSRAFATPRIRISRTVKWICRDFLWEAVAFLVLFSGHFVEGGSWLKCVWVSLHVLIPNEFTRTRIVLPAGYLPR